MKRAVIIDSGPSRSKTGCGFELSAANAKRNAVLQPEGKMKPHPNEPSLSELKEIRRELYVAPSTDENGKKLHAVECQIARRTVSGRTEMRNAVGTV